jgi:NAD(P)-dependent dehydrogenase (short-subunit alcohol dehydrogenase family)
MEATSLTGRVAVVTGAGRGFGRVIAEGLAAEGMALLLLARTGAQVRAVADDLAERHGVPCLPAAIDVTDAAAVDRIVLHAEQHLGTVDLLVNNAGVIERAELPFWEADLDDVWRVVRTNLRGPMTLTRALLPVMIQRGRGHVVNVTSRARAATRTGTYTGYAVSKRGLSVFTESLAASLEGTGVVALDVLPGLVRTDMTESMPTWSGVTDWDDPVATARVIADVARGRYDDRAGQILDAPALARDEGWRWG